MKKLILHYLPAFACLATVMLYSCSDEETTQAVVDPYNGHEYVDLGLSVMWATCNIGAEKPQDYGDYFAWGETEPKDCYNWSTYKWCNGDLWTLTKYCINSNQGYNGFTDGKTELEPEDDAAYVNWGPQWRMPTKEQQDELWTNCTWTWTTRNGVNGRLVTGPNGNSIFLPAAGLRLNELLGSAGGWGSCWSSALDPSNTHYACSLYFRSYDVGWYDAHRCFGFSVRAVRVQ